MISVGIGLHNLGEGLAVDASFNVGAATLGTFLVNGFIQKTSPVDYQMMNLGLWRAQSARHSPKPLSSAHDVFSFFYS